MSARFLTENRDAGGGPVAAGADRAALRRRRGGAGAGAGAVGARSRCDGPRRHRLATRSTRWPMATIPMAASASGTVDSVAALTRDDIVAAHARHHGAGPHLCGRGGRHQAGGAGRAARRPAGRSARRGRAAARRGASSLLPGGVTVVTFPRRSRWRCSASRASRATIRTSSPPSSLNEIFGGSRLQVAPDGGGAGKARADLWDRHLARAKDHAELVWARWPRPTTRWPRRMDVVRAEWARIATEGVTQAGTGRGQDLSDRGISAALRRQRHDRRASLWGCRWTACPSTTSTTRNDRSNAVTLEDIKRVVQRICCGRRTCISWWWASPRARSDGTEPPACRESGGVMLRLVA